MSTRQPDIVEDHETLVNAHKTLISIRRGESVTDEGSLYLEGAATIVQDLIDTAFEVEDDFDGEMQSSVDTLRDVKAALALVANGSEDEHDVEAALAGVGQIGRQLEETIERLLRSQA